MVKVQTPIAKGTGWAGASLAGAGSAGHNAPMTRAERVQLGVGLLGLTACAAANVWVFRFGLIAGLVGLNLTKHLGVAVLCQALGINRATATPQRPRRRATRHPAHRRPAGPHARTRDRT